MLIISTVHPQKWPKLIDRWELDAINVIERISHTLDNIRVKMFIENMLGKLYWEPVKRKIKLGTSQEGLKYKGT